MQKASEAEYYYDDYNTFFIDDISFDILRDTFYSLPVTETNCILLMNIFDLKAVNPTHPTDDPEAPTEVIFFCIRFIDNDKYQPIGGLLVYSDRDQSDVVADCIRKMLKDLYEMGLYVLCSVSPHYKIFKNVIRALNPSKDYDKEPDVMCYFTHQKYSIIHLFDAELLMNKFHRIFMAKDVTFKTSCGPSVDYYALWSDIFYTLDKTPEYNVYLNFLLSKGYWPRKLQSFTQSVWLQHSENTLTGLMTQYAYSGTLLLSVINAYMGIFSCDFLKPQEFAACWEEILYTFESMEFLNIHNLDIPKIIDEINSIKITLNERDLLTPSQIIDNIRKKEEKAKESAISADHQPLSVAKPEIASKSNVAAKQKVIPAESKAKADSTTKKRLVAKKVSNPNSMSVLGPHSVKCKAPNCTGCVITVDLKKEYLAKQQEGSGNVHEHLPITVESKTVMGAHLSNCKKKKCTGCVGTDRITNKQVGSGDVHKPVVVPVTVEPGKNSAAEEIGVVKPSTGAIKKTLSRRKRKKKKTETEQNVPKTNPFIVEDHMIAEILGDGTQPVQMDQQWDLVNVFKRIRDTMAVTIDPNGENCTLPCINGRDVSWEEPLNIDVDPESLQKDLLCTVKGTAYFISMLLERNIWRIKANSMLVEPVEEMVTRIQKTFNKMRFIQYLGRPYEIYDAQVFPFTLCHNKSLYLVKKD